MITNVILISVTVTQTYSPMKKQRSSISQKLGEHASCSCARQERHTADENSL